MGDSSDLQFSMDTLARWRLWDFSWLRRGDWRLGPWFYGSETLGVDVVQNVLEKLLVVCRFKVLVIRFVVPTIVVWRWAFPWLFPGCFSSRKGTLRSDLQWITFLKSTSILANFLLAFDHRYDIVKVLRWLRRHNMLPLSLWLIWLPDKLVGWVHDGGGLLREQSQLLMRFYFELMFLGEAILAAF
jgi:hypothetical protein